MAHTTHFVRTDDGLALYKEGWLPSDPKAIVLLLHGYGEHSGRYGHVVQRLKEQGLAVHSFDQRGHGRSEGERANIRDFGELIGDANEVFSRVRLQHGGMRCFVLGHSVGAVVALKLAIERPRHVSGLIVTAPYVRNAVSAPWPAETILRMLSAIAPALPVVRLPVRQLSRDPAVVRAYEEDPLVYHGLVKARMAAQLLVAGRCALERAAALSAPMLILHGGEDQIASVTGARELHEAAGSADKTLKIYPRLYHEVLNEPERRDVLADILGWLEARLG